MRIVRAESFTHSLSSSLLLKLVLPGAGSATIHEFGLTVACRGGADGISEDFIHCVADRPRVRGIRLKYLPRGAQLWRGLLPVDPRLLDHLNVEFGDHGRRVELLLDRTANCGAIGRSKVERQPKPLSITWPKTPSHLATLVS
jgi:hypothetical protein